MKVQKNHGMNILQRILGVLLLMSILYFIWGEIFLPGENYSEVNSCTTFGENWERILPDGTTEPVTVPGECDVESGDVLVIRKMIPQDQENTWLCIRTSQQDIKIYVGEELRKEYTTKDTRQYGKNSVSLYVFFEITSEDAGQPLRMEIVSNSPYSGYINQIYMGEKFEIWKLLFERYFPGTVIALFMMLLSAAVVVYSGIIQHIYKKKMEISYLGVGLFVASIWLIAESRLRQLLLPNSSVASDVGFFMVMLLPYPFLSYINIIQKRRYQKCYMMIAFCAVVNFIFATVFQIMNIKDFSETMIISHAIIVILIVALFVTVIIDIRRGHVREYPEVAAGLAGLMLAGVYEIYLVYDKSSLYNGIVLCLALVFLLFTAGIKTGRDMLKLEKEKQMAIVANESKSKFLANMSHEIRTPINTIIGMTEMILREDEDEATLEYAGHIKNAGHMLLELISDILDFSKLEVGKLEISESPYQVSSMLNDVILGTRMRVKNKNVKIQLDIDENVPSVLKGDEIRIKQILNNLLSNAVKYTKQGSVTFIVKGIWEENIFSLQFSVKDTGIGIREEDMAALFDSFKRVDITRNRNIEGTGLGLNITKQLVEQMNGTIDVTSEYEKGSCFTVRLPQEIIDKTAMGNLESAHKSQMAEKSEAKSMLYAPNASVLVVDDTEINLTVVKALLKQTGIQLDFAGGGNECLSMCKDKKYDLILLDHMMPEPDGVQTLHLLREDTESLNQNTEVIVLTANAIAGAAEQYIREGFSDYLSKPIEYNKLERMLSKYLDAECRLVEDNERKTEKDGVRMELLDRELGLRNCGNMEELYEQVLQMYCENGQQNLKDLSEYYTQQNWENYAILTHAIKSTSLTIGAQEFSEKAKQQEMAAKEKNVEFISAEWETFIAEYKKILSYVEKENA